MLILKHSDSDIQGVSTRVQDSLLAGAQAGNGVMATISRSCDGNNSKGESGENTREMHGELVIQADGVK
jgi:hypothetical protein